MFSVPDIMVVSVLALLLFGPDKLPNMMRQVGRVMREVQNTSQSFIAEMERAGDVPAPPAPQLATASVPAPVAEPAPPSEPAPQPVAEPHGLAVPPAPAHLSPTAEPGTPPPTPLTPEPPSSHH